MYDLYKRRRSDICSLIKEQYGSHTGAIILSSDFESERYSFRQDSTFYYFTGISEPGVTLILYLDGRSILYIPKYAQSRTQWLTTEIDKSDACASTIGVDEIKYLGEPIRGYSFSPLFLESEFSLLSQDLQNIIDQGFFLYICQNQRTNGGVHQRLLYNFFTQLLPQLCKKTADVSSIVGAMRRKKTLDEIRYISHAIGITTHAQRAAARGIAPGSKEYEVQAIIEGIFTSLGSPRCAFPSIVATGQNSTVLHYTDRNQMIEAGDLVVIDIGAEFGYYAADITRTYPASGRFTSRQKEIYEIVRGAQAYIEGLAKPGMYLNNPDEKQKSLHHLAYSYLQDAGYSDYFVHGIGHFLGLDVHDTGDVRLPLEAGDVFTIEPGIYLSDEKLGVRIEDDYVITDDGCFCLSSALPKTPDEIEEMINDTRA